MVFPDGSSLTESLVDGLARLDLVETRVTSLEEMVHQVVANIPQKMCNPLLAHDTESSEHRSSSLLQLSEQGNVDAMLTILTDEKGKPFSIHDRTPDGDSALHIAATRGHLKAVIVLLGAGAKVDVVGHRLRTPLHCAAASGHLRVIKHLIDAGAKIDVKDANGATALCLATEAGYTDLVELLVRRGSRPNEKNILIAVWESQRVLVGLILQSGVPADACNEDGETLLVHAAKGGRWDMVGLLLERGATATKCKKTEECALALAAKGGQAESARRLLIAGAAANADQVKVALAAARCAAVVWAFVDVVPDAVRGEAGIQGLLAAAADGRLEPLLALLEGGVSANAKNQAGRSGCHLAAAGGHVACAAELLRRGGGVNAKDNVGDTPLHLAAAGGKEESVRALLVAGANAAQKNNAGKSPLEVAASDAVRRAFSSE